MEENQYYVLQTQTNQTFGPITETEVREWIQQTRLGKFDSISKVGENGWTPLSMSKFQSDLTSQLALQQIAATTCPNCSAEMVAVTKSDQVGVWLVIVGVVLTVVCIGLPFWIYGMIRLHGNKGKVFYQCPRCQFATN